MASCDIRRVRALEAFLREQAASGELVTTEGAIAQAGGVSARWVRAGLAKLEAAGVITRHRVKTGGRFSGVAIRPNGQTLGPVEFRWCSAGVPLVFRPRIVRNGTSAVTSLARSLSLTPPEVMSSEKEGKQASVNGESAGTTVTGTEPSSAGVPLARSAGDAPLLERLAGALERLVELLAGRASDGGAAQTPPGDTSPAVPPAAAEASREPVKRSSLLEALGHGAERSAAAPSPGSRPPSAFTHPANSVEAPSPTPAKGGSDARTLEEYERLARACGRSEQAVEADKMRLLATASREDWIGRAVRSALLIRAKGGELADPVAYVWSCVRKGAAGAYEDGAFGNWDEFDGAVARERDRAAAPPRASTRSEPVGDPGPRWLDRARREFAQCGIAPSHQQLVKRARLLEGQAV